MNGNKNKRLIFIRIVLWIGIIADFISALLYCFPESAMSVMGIAAQTTPLLRFILIQAAALMAGWTLLLVWTGRKPVERRGVMLLTAPIALGIGGSFCYLSAQGILVQTSLFIIAGPFIIAGLFLAAYLTASKLNKRQA